MLARKQILLIFALLKSITAFPNDDNTTAAAIPVENPSNYTREPIRHSEQETSLDISAGESSSVNEEESSETVDPIIIYRNKFFNSRTGDQFFIKGIAYQPSVLAGDGAVLYRDGSKYIDPMAEPSICLRDLPYLIDLGVNTVRVYSIDPDKDHDECFNAFAAAGIYVTADLSEPDTSVVRESPTWDVTLLERYQKVVDALQGYDNVLGFFAGNEVTNDKTNTDASPFVKSSLRDIKNYIAKKGYRKIPVGYATNDDAETRASVADYFTCGEDAADFYGINMYEWCGYSTYWASGYKDRTEQFKNFPVPVFFSEFGCNVKRPRPFTEVEALYSRIMSDTWSGGIAYMYFEEPNQYGVIQLVGGEVTKLDDYDNLKAEFHNVSPAGTTLETFKKKVTEARVPECPKNNRVWEASNVIPHSPDSSKCDCMERSLKCKLNPQIKQSADIQKIFSYACAIADCSAIKADGKLGEYGTFSDCSVRQKASYVINEVYQLQGAKEQNCYFNGQATLNDNVASTEELESLFIESGKTCAAVLRANNIKKILLINTNSTLSNLTSSNDTRHSHYENNASTQKTFYENITKSMFSALVLVIALVVFA